MDRPARLHNRRPAHLPTSRPQPAIIHEHDPVQLIAFQLGTAEALFDYRGEGIYRRVDCQDAGGKRQPTQHF
ncbi:hypothetical protein SBA2_10069 [Acidobacteriia bacterium SbA2]|nr:hypothetical protein SBA2_10069 [Acidobacteriia bacterium SbA2]